MEYSRRPTKSIPKENQLKILNKIYQTYLVSTTYLTIENSYFDMHMFGVCFIGFRATVAQISYAISTLCGENTFQALSTDALQNQYMVSFWFQSDH